MTILYTKGSAIRKSNNPKREKKNPSDLNEGKYTTKEEYNYSCLTTLELDHKHYQFHG